MLIENKNKQTKKIQDCFGITGVQFGRKIPVSGVMPASQYHYLNNVYQNYQATVSSTSTTQSAHLKNWLKNYYY